METENCSKCNATLDTEGYPKWCKVCRAKYRREYESVKGEMSENKGFAKGVEALRHVLVTEFLQQGSGKFSGYECADLISQAPGPRLSE